MKDGRLLDLHARCDRADICWSTGSTPTRELRRENRGGAWRVPGFRGFRLSSSVYSCCCVLCVSPSIRCEGLSPGEGGQKVEPAVPTGGAGDAAAGGSLSYQQAARSVRLNISHSYDICHDGFASLSLSLFHPFLFILPLFSHSLDSLLIHAGCVSTRTGATAVVVVVQWSIGLLCSLHQSASGSLANISGLFFIPTAARVIYLFIYFFQMSRYLLTAIRDGWIRN